MGWTSRLAKRVARSTCTAGRLAAADAENKLTCSKLVVEENLGTKLETIELILDSRSAFYLCSTLRKPKEIKNKLLLSSIQENYLKDLMATIRWTPGSSHLADVLTKDIQKIVRQLDK